MSEPRVPLDKAVKPRDPDEDADALAAGEAFFLKVPVCNANGTMQANWEEGFARHDIDDVIQQCVAETEEHGTESYVYECRAVRRIVRPKTKVIVLKATKR